LKIIARPKKHQNIIARPVFPLYFSLKIIARPKKHKKIVARPVLLQN